MVAVVPQCAAFCDDGDSGLARAERYDESWVRSDAVLSLESKSV